MAQAFIHAKKTEVKTTLPQMREGRGPTFTSDGRLIEKMMREGRKLKPLLGSKHAKYDMHLL